MHLLWLCNYRYCVQAYIVRICDCPRENQPNSHLGMIVEIPVLKVVRPALLSRIILIDILNLI